MINQVCFKHLLKPKVTLVGLFEFNVEFRFVLEPVTQVIEIFYPYSGFLYVHGIVSIRIAPVISIRRTIGRIPFFVTDTL